MMAVSLVVEDGSAKDVANSYVTIQEADDYWELRNDTSWAALTDEAKIAALVQAAQYLDYSYRYIGTRMSSTQAMTWPRGVEGWDEDFRELDADMIPQRIKDAQCELARESALNGALLPVLDRGNRIQSQTVGPVSVTYFGDAPSSKTYPLVDTILADLLVAGSSGGMIDAELA